MKHFILIIFIILGSTNIIAQSGVSDEEYEAIRSFEKKLTRYYQQKKQRYLSDDEHTNLEKELKTIKAKYPESYASYYLPFHLNGIVNPELIDELKKAESISSKQHFHLDDFIDYYEIKGNASQRAVYSKKLFQTGMIDKGVLEYHQNVLNSCDKNSFLFTFGYHDSYALRILQDVKGIRKDVTLIQYDLLKNEAYRKKIAQKLGVSGVGNFHSQGASTLIKWLASSPQTTYLTLTFSDYYFQKIGWSKLYATGLVYQYSSSNIYNIEKIANNWKNFQNKYFTVKTSSLQHSLNKNYLVPMITWYRSLPDGKEQKNTLEKEILELAEFLKLKTEVQKLLEK